MKLFCGFKYELLTTDEQRSALSRTAGCRRFVFNKALELQNKRREKGLAPLRYAELTRELTVWKKEQETDFLKQAMSEPLQQTLKDLDRAICESLHSKSEASRKGWPKFKAKDIGDGFRILRTVREDRKKRRGERHEGHRQARVHGFVLLTAGRFLGQDGDKHKVVDAKDDFKDDERERPYAAKSGGCGRRERYG